MGTEASGANNFSFSCFLSSIQYYDSLGSSSFSGDPEHVFAVSLSMVQHFAKALQTPEVQSCTGVSLTDCCMLSKRAWSGHMRTHVSLPLLQNYLLLLCHISTGVSSMFTNVLSVSYQCLSMFVRPQFKKSGFLKSEAGFGPVGSM